jgi:hypothetical protein
MPRHELELRLDAPGAVGLGNALTEASARVRERVYHELGLKAFSNAWVRIDVGTEKGRRTLKELLQACRSGRVVAGAATLYERLTADESAATDWFYLATKTADESFSLWDDYPSFRPSEVAREHALNHTFVSEAFVAACARAKLRGISFLRCRPRGRKPAPAWFAALPEHGLGRGLDHPWFDRRRWLAEVGDDHRKRSSSLDTAQYAFHQRFLRQDRIGGVELLRPLLELFPMSAQHASTLEGLSLVTVPRYWSKALPDADFAYVPWGEDGPNREGKLMRFRMLAANARARRALIEASLLAEKAFLAVHTVGAPEAGVELLDARHPPVPPMYTAAELAALRARERTLFPA